MPEFARDWAVALFRRSVLKQRKLAEIVALLGPSAGPACLDLGSDNGVVSLLLRERGGSWGSGDLTEQAVASIRSLVGEDGQLVSGERLPYPDACFDRWWSWTCWSTCRTKPPSRARWPASRARAAASSSIDPS